MGMEALQLVLGLQQHTQFAGRVLMSSHGDVDDPQVVNGLPADTQQQVARMMNAAATIDSATAASAIIVCHSEPGAWALPHPLYETRPCPPVPLEQSAFVVARSMWEADRLPKHHVERMNQLGEVWVPTEFHRDSFAASGVDARILHVVPEPVDVHNHFDPLRHRPLPLPLDQRVFGPDWPHISQDDDEDGGLYGGDESSPPFVFLSVFKWETRKGWDVLLRAYLTAFTAEDNVLLMLSTKPFHSESNFVQQMEAWARRELGDLASDLQKLPSVYVASRHLPQTTYPSLFKSADCFVLPTRGEGWGLPVVEAMAMELPVIVTNWSGPTAYLDDTVGYPLAIDGLAEVQEGAFKGNRMAEPSVDHLVQLMQHVVGNRFEAMARGRAARRRMVALYSPAAVAQIVEAQLRRIEGALGEEE
ncbi:hypothetical protein D9Q98_000294 [Chlorella vulgaris]|uniref:Glycosyl transferase family 1 domain-containing protein n=1 Tax=Chlorella vulgaris TaxID=3077 RepID=A0A9D4TXX8_CHLVU|nr:hypothetical protein D9Q98_000294 [Chlorella vulgaris]